MITRPNVLLGIAIAALAVPACGSVDGTEPKSASFAVADEHLTIAEQSGGDVEFHPGDIDEIEVTRRVSGTPDEATWELEDDELILATDCGLFSPCNVRYEVAVPRDMIVTLDTSNGNVTASDFATPLAIRTANGDIAVNEISAALSMSNTSGDQHATELSSSDVQAQAENGRIELDFNDARSNVSVTTHNGSVRNGLSPGGDGSHRIEAATENGDIDLRTN